MLEGNLFVISGPSGVGKGTLVAQIMQKLPNAWLSVSATTRKPREDEVDGVSYFFLEEDDFLKRIETQGMLEWAKFNAHYYGTPLQSVVEHMEKGEQVILEIEVQGAFQVKERIPQARLVFIEPPSLEILEQRLRGRGTESEEQIAKRLRIAQDEMKMRDRYDKRIVNDNLDSALSELLSYIEDEAK